MPAAIFFIVLMITIVMCVSLLIGTRSSRNMEVLGGGGDPSVNDFEDEEIGEGRLVVLKVERISQWMMCLILKEGTCKDWKGVEGTCKD